MSDPLRRLRVIELTRGLAGTRAGGLLAEYGADVIRVVSPDTTPYEETPLAPATRRSANAVFNRGKRSVEIDLEADKESLLDLLGTADVFLNGYDPAEVAHLDLEFEQIHDTFHELVYTSISGGYDPDSPHADLPGDGYEGMVHAVMGGMSTQEIGSGSAATDAEWYHGAPMFQGLPYASIGAAYLAVMGTLAGVHRRAQDGIGRQIETSLTDGALVFLSMFWVDFEGESDEEDDGGMRRSIVDEFECADGKMISVHTGALGAFDRLMAEVGLGEEIPPTDARHDIGEPLDPAKADLLESELPKAFKQAPREEWLERLLEADVCAIPALKPTEVFDRPQPRHNNMVVEVDDATLGTVEQVAPPFKLGDGTEMRRPSAAPESGAHTEEVLEELGAEAGTSDSTQPTPAGDADLLSDLTIVDFGSYIAGPFGARLLGDLGADVVLVEHPRGGDPLRGTGSPFVSSQANKRSIAIDMKADRGQEIAHRLIEAADAVTQNMRPGVAERLGIGYEQATAINPELTYLYAPGWGSTGPDADRQSFAPKMSAYTGVNFEISGQGNKPLPPTPNGDAANGLLGAIGMLLGVVDRDLHGDDGAAETSSYVECPQLHAAMWQVGHATRHPDNGPIGTRRLTSDQKGTTPLNRLYETADDWVCICAGEPHHIEGVASVLGVDITEDPRFATPDDRIEHADALVELVGQALDGRQTEEVVAALRDAGVPAAQPVLDNEQRFLSDDYNLEVGRVAEVDHPTKGIVREHGRLIRASHTAEHVHQHAPELGEHTRPVLAELGYSEAEIARLESDEVVRSGPPAE